MKLRTLGKTGFKVSEIGLGCWQLGNNFGMVEDTEAEKILSSALAAGINFYDTADVYGGGLSETRIGQWKSQLTKPPIIATKVGRDGALYPDKYSKASIKASLQASMTRLNVEIIDLAQLHCVPREILFDGEILNWMEDLQQEGVIRHFGASVEMLDEAMFCTKHPKLATLQILFNVLRQDAIEELLPTAADNDIGIIVRLPLASGLLSGKMQKDQTFAESDHRNYNADGAAFHVGETFNGLPYNKGVELVDQLRPMLEDGQKMLDLALRWILDQPQVSSVIAGASRAEQVINNAKTSSLTPLSLQRHHQLAQFYKERVRGNIRGGI